MHRKPLSESLRSKYILEAISARLQWRTWIRLCGDDRDKAFVTLLYHQFGGAAPLPLDSATCLGPFMVSRRGYHAGFAEFFRRFGILLEQHEGYSFAYISRLDVLVPYYVSVMHRLGKLRLPPSPKPLMVDVYSDMNCVKLRTFGVFLHFLDAVEPQANYAWLPIAIMHNRDTRAACRTLFATHPSQPWTKGTTRRRSAAQPPSSLLSSVFVEPQLGRTHGLAAVLDTVTTILVNGELREISYGCIGDCKAASPLDAPRQTERRGAYDAGVGAAFFAQGLCFYCGASGHELYSQRVTDFGGLEADEWENTTLFSVNRSAVGMLHNVPSVFGFVRDILVTFRFFRGGARTNLDDVIDHAKLGKGWAPYFGCDRTGRPLDPSAVASARRATSQVGKASVRWYAKEATELTQADAQHGMGLQFRPEYNQLLRFFGLPHSYDAYWYYFYCAIKDFQRSGPNYRSDFASLLNDIQQAMGALKEWFDGLHSTTPDVGSIRQNGHFVWRTWNSMLATVFPLDPDRFHPEVRRAQWTIAYDPRQFAIGVASHAALVHTHEWVTKWTPHWSQAIEIGGEHALSLISQLAVRIGLQRYRFLERPGVHLCVGIGHTIARLLRHAESEIVDETAAAQMLSEAVAEQGDSEQLARCAGIACGIIARVVRATVARSATVAEDSASTTRARPPCASRTFGRQYAHRVRKRIHPVKLDARRFADKSASVRFIDDDND